MRWMGNKGGSHRCMSGWVGWAGWAGWMDGLGWRLIPQMWDCMQGGGHREPHFFRLAEASSKPIVQLLTSLYPTSAWVALTIASCGSRLHAQGPAPRSALSATLWCRWCRWRRTSRGADGGKCPPLAAALKHCAAATYIA